MKLKEEILKKLLERKPKNREELNNFKREAAKEFKIKIPSNFDLFSVYQRLLKKRRIKRNKKIEDILKKKPVRSLSGIVNVSVLTKPYLCPGKCIFCPTEKGFPKSYLSGEPAAERAKSLKFNPFLQVKKRIENLKLAGHPTDKIELRIVGGTFSVYSKEYQERFIKKCFDGANERKSKDLKEAQRKNERAKNRIVGISIETRPDFINEKEIKFLRKLGITLVELGVQSVFEEILKKNKTGLKLAEIVRATKLLKDSGFKVLYHLMPNLLGSNLKKDLKTFEIVFSDQKFKPDWIKIYPLVVVKNSQIYQFWKKKIYKTYSVRKLIELLIKVKETLPRWVRITRILRDIPSTKIIAGCKISNLREVVEKEMEKRNLKCRCIRCREVREKYNLKEKVYLFREDYEASEGKEIFLSFENKKKTKLYSFLRLRIPSQVFKKEKHFIKVLEDSAIIREIQTYGQLIPVAEKKLAPQHRGLGKKLVKEAEKITKKEFNLPKIAAISGIGARGYWRKLGYRLKETYLVKAL